jgi:dynein heavy chain 2
MCFFRFGKVLIIQEVDNIDPVLFPILQGDLINQGKNMRNGL